jgi:hypothetical protein
VSVYACRHGWELIVVDHHRAEPGKVLNGIFPTGRPISLTKVRSSIRTGQPATAVDTNCGEANQESDRRSMVANAFGNPVKMDVFSVAVNRPVRKCRG